MALSQDEFFSDEFFEQFPELATQVTKMGSDLFPVDTLSDEEISRSNELTNQAQRLTPMERPAMQRSNRIRGNPHSFDTSSINNAVQQGLVQLINANRERKLLGKGDDPGIMGELRNLETKSKQAREQQEKQDDFLARTMPDVVDRLMQTEQSLKTEDNRQENRLSLEEQRAKNATDLQELRGQQQKDLQELKDSARSASEGGEGVPTSVITNFANQGKNAAQTLFKQVDRMDEQLSDSVQLAELRRQARANGEDPQEYIESIRNERDQKYQQAWNMLSLGAQAMRQGGLPDDLIDQYETQLNIISGQEDLDDL